MALDLYFAEAENGFSGINLLENSVVHAFS
jgi:hypothetical protein